MSRILRRLPALVAAAAYLAAAVGGTGLHGLTGDGHARCGHEHGGHDHADGRAGCSHAHGGHGEHRHGPGAHSCETDGAEDTPGEPASPAHDPHHCAVCQFLAMGQQVAEAPRPVDVAGPAPAAAVEWAPSVGSEPALTARVRGPPAAVCPRPRRPPTLRSSPPA